MFSGMVCRFKNSCFQFTYLLYIDIYFPKKKNYKPSLSKQLLIYNRSLGVSRLASEVRPRQRAQSFTKTTRIKKTHTVAAKVRVLKLALLGYIPSADLFSASCYTYLRVLPRRDVAPSHPNFSSIISARISPQGLMSPRPQWQYTYERAIFARV